jgi:hypothetical protein
MITLSPTKARANLTFWLKAAVSGEDVGILYGDRVIALRPVAVESTDYALREYGVGVEEMDRFSKRAHEEIEKDRRSGNLRTFTGDIEDLFECRSDLDTRILFLVVTAPGELVFFAMGNHDEVRSLLKTA